MMVCGLVYAYFLFSVNLPYCTTVYPRINVDALIFEDALNFRKQVHALIFEHKQYFNKKACTYIRTWNDLDKKYIHTAWCRAKRSNKSRDWSSFKKYRNKLKNNIKAKHKAFMAGIGQAVNHNPKRFWFHFKSKTKQKKFPKPLNLILSHLMIIMKNAICSMLIFIFHLVPVWKRMTNYHILMLNMTMIFRL